MHIPSLVKIHWSLLKLSSGNENRTDGRTIDGQTDRHTDVQHETIIPRHYCVTGYNKKKSLHIWICLFHLRKVCFGCWGGGNHYFDSTAQTAMQQHVVEHGKHDKAQQKSWSSTASGLSSRLPDTVLSLDPARSGREGEVDCALLPHYNPIHSTCHLNQQHTFTASTHMRVIQKPYGDGRVAKQQVRKHWKL